MGIILSIIAILLSWIIFPFSFVYTFIRLTIKAKFKTYFNHIDKLFYSIAVSIDQLGNTVCQHLFNDIMIKKDGYKFGNVDETISYVLGANAYNHTLTKLGMWLCKMLDFFDKNHIQKAYINGN